MEAYARALNTLTDRSAVPFAEDRFVNDVDLNGFLDAVVEIEQALAEVRNVAGCEAEIVEGFPVRWTDITAIITTNIVRSIDSPDPDLSGATVERLTESPLTNDTAVSASATATSSVN